MEKNADGTYDVIGNVGPKDLKPFVKKGKLTIAFNEVDGDFEIDDIGLKTLEGCPKKVTGDFRIYDSDIETMKYCPKEIGKDLVIIGCDHLTSLIGCPEQNDKVIMFANCDKLTSLKGAPQSCRICVISCKSLKSLEFLPQATLELCIEDCEELTSLECCPKSLRRDFKCTGCDKITSLKYAPESCENCWISLKSLESLDYLPQVEEDLKIEDCKALTSLKGCPEQVNGDFSCVDCDNITSLEGAPTLCKSCTIGLKSIKDLKNLPSVIDSLSIKNSEYLTSLEGCPTIVNGDFSCVGCDKITSLEYAPKSCKNCTIGLKSIKDLKNLPQIEEDLFLTDCKSLTSLQGCPNEVNGIFSCTGCDKITTLEFAPTFCYSCEISLENIENLDYLPQIVYDLKIIGCKNLTSLKGCPDKLEGCFICMSCDKITSLEFAPKSCLGCQLSLNNIKNLQFLPAVEGDLMLQQCENLESLVGCPSVLTGNFECFACQKLTSLEGAPTEIGWNFKIGYCCNLESLKGCPSELGGDFECFACHKLTSLVGLPSEIDCNLKLNLCGEVESLAGCPTTVYGNLYWKGCPFTKADITAVCSVQGDIEF